MIKYKRVTEPFMVCDHCNTEDRFCKSLPVDQIRVSSHPQNEWETQYRELCPSCLTLFMNIVKEEFIKFIETNKK